MPFRVSWGPGPGAVTVVVQSAREALGVALGYEQQGRSDIAVSTLDGAELSIMELKALAAVDPAG